jgi:hypothetical protein
MAYFLVIGGTTTLTKCFDSAQYGFRQDIFQAFEMPKRTFSFMAGAAR